MVYPERGYLVAATQDVVLHQVDPAIYLVVSPKEGIMRRYALIPVFFALAGVVTCQAAASPKDQAADQAKCAGYGYQPGTTQFADCMMKLDTRREHQAASQKQNDADMKALSIKRNGDTRYPVCGAAMMDANLDTMNNAWYGPNCREK